ncbi:Uncharacterized protein TPAR_07375 [Tolypocladium paradoxum]|uniref:Uncharacterized protein n=1 Tax=Tolypocladium paradoxum TaxID=94208 RepID=A0A2S4KQF8_9HYPO|nr:Uncharacterized protein TPAR_07375 [Tolypocladium paradoxum]
MSSDLAKVPCTDLIEDVVKICGKHLQREWSHQRTPKGLEQGWRAAYKDHETSAHNIFLKKGLDVWVSLFLATRGRELRGPSGRTMHDFLDLPPEQQSIAATKLAEVQVNPTVRTAIERLQKRHRVDEAIEVTSASENDDENDDDNEGEGHGLQLSTEPADLDASTPNIIDGLCGKFSDASPKATSEFFPSYMNSAIRRNKVPIDNTYVTRAAITMTFPAIPSEKDDCAMSFEILENKVQHCAYVLFGIIIENEGNTRYVVHPNGSRMRFRNLDIQDCQSDAIAAMFGDDAERAIRKSKYFQEEKEEARGSITGCVRMAITQYANEGAVITLNLGLAEACVARDKLYSHK